MDISFKEECQKLFDHYVACYRHGDAKGCASVFAAEAEMYSPFGSPAIGRQAIEDTHAEWVAEGAEDKQITVTRGGRDGDLGWCLVDFSEGTTGQGVSLNVLARQPDGRWLVTHISLNETPL